MFNNYLCETIADISNSLYVNLSKEDWAIKYIECYSSIDEEHRKQLVL